MPIFWIKRVDAKSVAKTLPLWKLLNYAAGFKFLVLCYMYYLLDLNMRKVTFASCEKLIYCLYLLFLSIKVPKKMQINQ